MHRNHLLLTTFLTLVTLGPVSVGAQSVPEAKVQCNTFNATVRLDGRASVGQAIFAVCGEYQFMILNAAIQGYVVVAPDYAGLGVDRDAEGNFIPHQYLASNAAGYDLLYAAKAAKEAWPDVLGEDYVVMGHSQGGGAAWAAATILADPETPSLSWLRTGYRGTVAGSPWTSLTNALAHTSTAASLSSLVARIATGLSSLFPTFQYADWLTPKGERAARLLQDLQGCQSVAAELLASDDLARPDWNTSSWYAAALDRATSVVGRPFAGPMLVLQGTDDPAVSARGTAAAVDATCGAVRGAQLELVEFGGVSHTPVMFAGQQVWLDWVGDRFAGKAAASGCRRVRHEPLVDVAAYQKDRNWFLEWNQYSYGVA
ncbi:Alpha/Beta hydrolase protein [Xylariaceae sp. FL0016]|nr:Alpha/Beta hydrolase protein [Xylariaceae sp. FL0016]